MNRVVKNFLFVILATILLFACGGTTGHIAFYDFGESKDSIQNDLIETLQKQSLNESLPDWKQIKIQDSIRDIFVYFTTEPREIYHLSFTGDSSSLRNLSVCTLALVGLYDDKLWKYEKDLSSKEQARMMDRLTKQVLSKMKNKCYQRE